MPYVEINEQKIHALLSEMLRGKSWIEASFTTRIREGGSNPNLTFLNEQGDSSRLVPFEIFDIDDLFREPFNLMK